MGANTCVGGRLGPGGAGQSVAVAGRVSLEPDGWDWDPDLPVTCWAISGKSLALSGP